MPNIARWSQTKGIDIIATGDYTHPAWFEDIKDQLEPAEPGLYRLKDSFVGQVEKDGVNAAPNPKDSRPVRFVLSTELSCIYKKSNRTRRIHLVLVMPSVEAVERFNKSLLKRNYNLKSDGRPILGADAKDILALALEADESALMIPAHAWTPWFSVFGSKSGFDSLEECFEDLTPHITAIETGLSSDPPMNWRISGLDNIGLVSNSDAHSLRNLGREANVFDFFEPSFSSIRRAVSGQGQRSFVRTIEFFPEEGKYHADGHRDCGFRCEPEETERLGGKCPKCGGQLTRGVSGRVFALADRIKGEGENGKNSFSHIVPLQELVAETLGKSKSSKAVDRVYRSLINDLGPEFDVLLDLSVDDISRVDKGIGEAIQRMRSGEISTDPGYDGVFGTVSVLENLEKVSKNK